ncbi:hypothetical protein QBC46DRAFT_321463 [Diplogelasinospora grovesii]|uniref:Uncharacterized protein n=1 Tax=Diplogelasinospora grovesii TaxID=303347 RepID=A0AAN6N303_9PEZI|nr:hypothetical protein QBC46DRAFT_321463 [Diplogelasinospora grovesii]
MSLTRFAKRKRASTHAILGDLFEEEVINIPTRGPEPPKAADMYTEARLKEGLLYADTTLRYKQRKLSPLAAHCITLYKATMKAALEGDWMDEEERIALLNTILVYETEIYGTRALGFPSVTVDMNTVDRLAQLRRYVFAVRYGDYMAGVYERLKIPAQEDSTSYFEQLPGWERYWTDVQAEIEKETKSWDLWKRGNKAVDEERIKTTLAISTACNHMGLNFDNTIETIRSLYADRKSLLLHMPVLQMARSGKWNKLRYILQDDLRDLPVVMPPDFHKSIPALQHIIEAVVDQYFTRAEWNDHDYNWWEPRLENTLVSADLKDATTRPQAVAAERRAVKDRAERKFKQMVSEHSYLQLSATRRTSVACD